MPEDKKTEEAKKPESKSPKRTESENVSFPWEMLCVAVLFDLLGLIPIINFLTEILAGLILGLWQWMYAPKTNPLITFLVAKIIDALSLGILPSNTAIVVYAYLKKKTAQLAPATLGETPGQAVLKKAT